MFLPIVFRFWQHYNMFSDALQLIALLHFAFFITHEHFPLFISLAPCILSALSAAVYLDGANSKRSTGKTTLSGIVFLKIVISTHIIGYLTLKLILSNLFVTLVQRLNFKTNSVAEASSCYPFTSFFSIIVSSQGFLCLWMAILCLTISTNGIILQSKNLYWKDLLFLTLPLTTTLSTASKVEGHSTNLLHPGAS